MVLFQSQLRRLKVLMKLRDWARLQHFSADETFVREGEDIRSFPEPEMMNRIMMFKLDKARGIAGRVFIVTSSYREGDDRAHGKGLAVDIRVRGSAEREDIAEALKGAGFPRRGIYDKHVHGDTDHTRPRGIWGGKSR